MAESIFSPETLACAIAVAILAPPLSREQRAELANLLAIADAHAQG